MRAYLKKVKGQNVENRESQPGYKVIYPDDHRPQSNKLYEAGDPPYRLTTDITAKDFSDQQNTNPECGLLFTLCKFNIIENSYTIEQPYYNKIATPNHRIHADTQSQAALSVAKSSLALAQVMRMLCFLTWVEIHYYLLLTVVL